MKDILNLQELNDMLFNVEALSAEISGYNDDETPSVKLLDSNQNDLIEVFKNKNVVSKIEKKEVTKLEANKKEEIPVVNQKYDETQALKSGALVTVQHLENADEVYVMLCENLETYSELLLEIQNLTVKKLPFKIGDCCAAKLDDDVWYRARILNVNTIEDTYTVYFVDYGNVSSGLTLSSLVSLNANFITCLPPQAIKVKLNVKVLNMEEFCNSLLGQEFNCLLLNQEEEEKETPYVQLIKDDKNIMDTLAENKIVQIPSTSTTAATDKKEVKEEVVKSILPSKLDREVFTEITLTHFISPTEFFVLKKSDEEEMVNLVTDLQYDPIVLQTTSDYKPRVGDFVAAMYSEMWYRAQILNFDEASGKYSVYFVDYGNEESGLDATSSIRILSDKFKKLPQQSIKVCLSGIQPGNGKEWTPEEINDFVNLIVDESDNATLFVEPVDSSSDDHDEKISVILKNQNGVIMNDKCVQLKIGKETKKSPSTSDQEDAIKAQIAALTAQLLAVNGLKP